MKALITIFVAIATFEPLSFAEGFKVIGDTSPKVVQQTLVVTLTHDLCGRPSSIKDARLCLFGEFQLNLPEGGKIIGAAEKNEFLVSLFEDAGGNTFIDVQNLVPSQNRKSRLRIGEGTTKIHLIYQGPEIVTP
ncbi:MAG: hypothetical protein KDD22_07305 [Bdellovibrionales bacterium]|nr:hypothetical protein [Bdellovibrionales bacterium]